MNDWVEYFNLSASQRPRIYNVISLEFSDTKLAQRVRSPKLVRKADWIDRIWPRELKQQALSLEVDKQQQENGSTGEHETTPNLRVGYYPKVQYYCLMSLRGSYTDFHIDFGGSSVWYVHPLFCQRGTSFRYLTYFGFGLVCFVCM